MGRKANIILISSAAVILLVCAVIVVRAVGGYIGFGSVAGEVAKLKAKGEPVSISEIVPPKVPDGENAALLYEKAFKLLPSMDADPQLRKLDEFVSDNEERKDPKEWEDARIAVAKCTAALEVAEDAANMPECRFQVDWERGWQAELPHLKWLHRLSTVVAAKTLTEARAGHTQDALDSMRLGVRLAESLRNEPGLITYLTRLRCIRRAVHCLDDIISQQTINEQLARGLGDELGQIELTRSGVRALQSERVLTIAFYESLPNMAQESLRNEMRKASHGTQPSLPVPAAAIVRTVMRRNELAYLRAMNRYIERGELPYRQIVLASGDGGSSKNRRRGLKLAGAMLTVARDFQRARDEGVAALSAARVLLALRLYQQRVGSYPHALVEIEKNLPEDPFSGHRFGYKRQGAGCLLYSIGPDLKDDSGLASKWGRLNGSQVPKGDITWKLDG